MNLQSKIYKITKNLNYLSDQLNGAINDYDTHIIKSIFVKRGNNTIRLKIIELTGLNYSAQEISNKINHGKVYIEQEKRVIRDLITSNFKQFEKYDENGKTSQIIKDFYNCYKFHIAMIFEKCGVNSEMTMLESIQEIVSNAFEFC